MTRKTPLPPARLWSHLLLQLFVLALLLSPALALASEPPPEFLFKVPDRPSFLNPDFIAAAPDGSVWVSAVLSSEVLKFDPADPAAVTHVGSKGSGDGLFLSPRGIAFDSAGNAYVADGSARRVQVFSSSGTFLGKWGSSGTGDGQFSNPMGVAVDDSDNVYVADYSNNNIQKFSSSGAFLGKWGSYGTGDGQFQYPTGIAVSAAGVYVVDWNSHRVQKFTHNGGFLGKWGTLGGGWGQFRYLYGIAVDNVGDVYVADTNNSRVQRFTGSGEFVSAFGGFGSGDGKFSTLRGVTVDDAGNVYAADKGNNLIQKFDANGNFLARYGSVGSGDAQFNAPWGLAADSWGNLYAADTGNGRIQKLDANGTFLTAWGTRGSADGQFRSPMAVALDSSGVAYIADRFNNRVQKFSSSGAFLGKWGSSGNGDGQFSMIAGIAVDGTGNVYVADSGNSRIQRFTGDGVFLAEWGAPGAGDGQMNFPQGIAVGSLGVVYVADTGNNRIQKFTTDGAYLGQWGGWGSNDGRFYSPSAVAVDGPGNVYVADTTNSRVQKFSPEGEFMSKWGVTGSAAGQFYYPRGIAVDNSGNVWVSDSGNNRIQKFKQALASAPSALSDAYYVDEDVALAVGAPGVLGNDSNGQGLSLAAALVSGPAHGALTLSGDGSFLYRPEPDFHGSDAFAYKAGNGTLESNVATVTIVVRPVNDAPVITNLSGPLDPILAGGTVSVSVGFADVDSDDNHQSYFSWDDGSAGTGVPIESGWTATGSHTYQAAGVYTVTVSVTDQAGAAVAASYEFVVVYEPKAGFVSGGGWIDSPEGAYAADLSLTGKATFGLVTRYAPGSTAPTGRLESQFRPADFSFVSESYRWLVVAGRQAQFRGAGSVNGDSGYSFLVTVNDSEAGADEIRVKIWRNSDGAVVYDNAPGSSDDIDLSNKQPLGAGNIIVHGG